MTRVLSGTWNDDEEGKGIQDNIQDDNWDQVRILKVVRKKNGTVLGGPQKIHVKSVYPL